MMTRNLAVVTPPSGTVVDLSLAKLQCNSLDEDDDLVSLQLQTATDMVSAHIRRTLLTTVYEYRLDAFPNQWVSWYAIANQERPVGQTYGLVPLPKPPLVAINNIHYIDIAGNDQVLDPSLYRVDTGGVLQGTFTPQWLKFFPWARAELASIRINYTAGYGTGDDVPSCAKSAILLLTAHLYRNREATIEGSQQEIPIGISRVLRPLLWGHYA